MATTRAGDGTRTGSGGPGGRAPGLSDALVTRTLALHAGTLQHIARRHSLCADDAADAVQRALELFLRHADRLDADRAHRWLFTVVKHEAMAVRAERQRILPREPYDFDAHDRRTDPSLDDHVVDADRAARSAEALGHLKPAEAQALLLQAAGRSYDDIGRELGWTRTKVNRCLAEGRARLRGRIAGIEAGEECDRVAPLLADLAAGGAQAAQLAAARRHLRACPACRAEVRAHHDARARVPAVVPGALLLTALQERALGAMTRAHAMLEAVTTGKAAAVAASAAALAGGGITAERALEPDRSAQRVVRTAERPPAPSSGAHDDGGVAPAPPRPATLPARAAATSAPAHDGGEPVRARRADPGTGRGTVAEGSGAAAPGRGPSAVAVADGPGAVEPAAPSGPGAVEPAADPPPAAPAAPVASATAADRALLP